MPSGFFGGMGIGPQAIGRSGAPPDPVPVAGEELITNGDFSSADGWTANAGWSIAGGVAVRAAPVAGDYVLQPVIVAHTWYRIAFDIVAISAGSVTPYFSTGSAGVAEATTGSKLQCNRSATSAGVAGWRGSTNSLCSIDNASCKMLTLSSLLSARTYASADCDLSAAITRTAGTQAGLCARLDSSSSPANFIIAYLDGAGNVKVDKCVAGVYTNVISGAVTYGSTKRLRLVCSGTSVSAYYDGTQVGSTVTVSDAGIVSNVLHGKFSTYASNTFAGYVAA